VRSLLRIGTEFKHARPQSATARFLRRDLADPELQTVDSLGAPGVDKCIAGALETGLGAAALSPHERTRTTDVDIPAETS
jgi:hypothetical protein